MHAISTVLTPSKHTSWNIHTPFYPTHGSLSTHMLSLEHNLLTNKDDGKQFPKIRFIESLPVRTRVLNHVCSCVVALIFLFGLYKRVAPVHFRVFKACYFASPLYPLCTLSRFLFLTLCLFTFTGGRGLTFTFAHVLVPSTYRWDRLATHRHWGPHSVCIPYSHAHFGRATAACVSSPKRLGCLHRLAHAARHGYF